MIELCSATVESERGAETSSPEEEPDSVERRIVPLALEDRVFSFEVSSTGAMTFVQLSCTSTRLPREAHNNLQPLYRGLSHSIHSGPWMLYLSPLLVSERRDEISSVPPMTQARRGLRHGGDRSFSKRKKPGT